MTANPIPVADMADELHANQSHPELGLPERLNLCHEVAVELFRARRGFWLAAAAGYVDVAEGAHSAQDESGCAEALADARRCLAAADHYAPTAVPA